MRSIQNSKQGLKEQSSKITLFGDKRNEMLEEAQKTLNYIREGVSIIVALANFPK